MDIYKKIPQQYQSTALSRSTSGPLIALTDPQSTFQRILDVTNNEQIRYKWRGYGRIRFWFWLWSSTSIHKCCVSSSVCMEHQLPKYHLNFNLTGYLNCVPKKFWEAPLSNITSPYVVRIGSMKFQFFRKHRLKYILITFHFQNQSLYSSWKLEGIFVNF